MQTLDQVVVADDFNLQPNAPGAATLQDVIDSAGGYFNITNAAVYVRLQFGRRGQGVWTKETRVPIGGGILAKGTSGIAFRNAVAGQAATVDAALAELSEPAVQIAATGQSALPASTGMKLVQRIGPLAAAQATFDFQGIPQDGAALLLELVARGTGAGADVLMTFNGDGAAADYTGERIQGSGGAASALEVLPGGLAGIDLGGIAVAASPAGSAGVITADIPGYAGTTFHKAIVANGFARQAAGAGGMVRQAWGGAWLNAAAVARLTLTLSAGNFDIGSVASLFSLPAA